MGKFFIARPIFAIALAAAIVLLGIISIFDLPIEQYPDITPPVVEGTWNRFLAFLISITGSALMGGLLISIFSKIITILTAILPITSRSTIRKPCCGKMILPV